MERKFNFAPGEYYHIYNRGTDKRKIFLDWRDHWRFMVLLYVANSRSVIHLSDHEGKDPLTLFDLLREGTLVDIGAYCLMPNHFHILIREPSNGDGNTSRFMLKLQTGFSMYFNKKYQRTGSLFEGTFRAKHVAEDNYLKYLFAYIHLNPIKITDPQSWERKIISDINQAKNYLSQYRFSSLPHYLGEELPESKILNPKSFPDYFAPDTEKFTTFIDDWLNYYTDQDQ
ncbi:MAG TPA: transposase [Candidatus Paceibacterota bacterium]